MNLCDLHWGKSKKITKEGTFDCSVDGKVQGPKLKKPLEISLWLTFCNSKEKDKMPLKRNVDNVTSGSEGTGTFTPLDQEETSEVKDSDSNAPAKFQVIYLIYYHKCLE